MNTSLAEEELVTGVNVLLEPPDDLVDDSRVDTNSRVALTTSKAFDG